MDMLKTIVPAAAALASSAISMLNSQQAKINVYDDKAQKIVQEIIVQFNPAEYSLSESVEYKPVKDRKSDSPVLNFAGGNTSRLKMTLYFNTFYIKPAGIDPLGLFSEEDVSEQVKKITQLSKIEGDAHHPPVVQFVWGSLTFTGFVKSVVSTYTMFANSGKPLRAKVDIEFYNKTSDVETKENPLQSPDRTKIRILSEDESLWNMAKKEYGDVRMWRNIAEANGIMDPLEIPAGIVLKVPAL